MCGSVAIKDIGELGDCGGDFKAEVKNLLLASEIGFSTIWSVALAILLDKRTVIGRILAILPCARGCVVVGCLDQCRNCVGAFR